jgi:Fe-S oxidoreductase
MRVGLFIPCYVDAFHPEVGVATLELLERLGCDVEYPLAGCGNSCDLRASDRSFGGQVGL